MTADILAPLGVYAVTVLLLSYAVMALWRRLLAVESECREDQKVMLPALAESSRALKASEELVHDLLRGAALQHRGEP